jgi:hypothetical protein
MHMVTGADMRAAEAIEARRLADSEVHLRPRTGAASAQSMASLDQRVHTAAASAAWSSIEKGARAIERRVNRSWGNADFEPKTIAHPKLMQTDLGDPDSVICDMGPLVQPHARRGASTLDEFGEQIQWQWDQRAQPFHPGRRVFDVGIGQGPATPSAAQWHRLDRAIQQGLDNATSDGNMGRDKTGVKAWFKFWEDEGGSPHRPMDPFFTTLYEKLAEEWKCMLFLAALVEERGISPVSAAVYFSQVQGWHSRAHGIKLCGGIQLSRLPQMIKGWKRVYGDPGRRVRRGFAPQKLREAMDLLLSRENPDHACIRAALSLALQGLLRGAEFCMTGAIKWNKVDHLARGDIAELSSRRLVVWMHPCKNMHHLKGKTVPLVIGGGGIFVDSVAEMSNYLRLDPGRGEGEPLFRLPSTGEALRDNDVMAWTRRLAAAVGLPPMEFGTHSYRIAGATALFAQGADPTVIRTMGRWSSDIYRLYVRACFDRCCDWSAQAGSCAVTDSVVDFDEVDDY